MALLAGLILMATAMITPQSSGYAVVLTWSAPASSPDPVTGYNVYRASIGFGYYQKLNSEPATATTYTDSTVQFSGKYIYFVKSVDAQGHESPPSDPWSATIPSHFAWALHETPIFWVLLLLVLSMGSLVALYLLMRPRSPRQA